MVLIANGNNYSVTRAEQVLTSGAEHLTIFSQDETIDITVLDTDLNACSESGFYIDSYLFLGFILNCIRKSFSDDGGISVSIEMVKSKNKDASGE